MPGCCTEATVAYMQVAVVNAGHVLAVAEVLAMEPDSDKPRRMLLAMPHGRVWFVRQRGEDWVADGAGGPCQLVRVQQQT